MKKYCAAIFIAAILKALGFFLVPAFAGVEDDIARAEREIELNEIARRINENTYQRVRRAISQTKRAQEALKSCEKLHQLTNRTKSLQEGFKAYARVTPSTTFEEYVWNECFREQWPFKSAADRLYKRFWDEELIREINRLYKGIGEKERKVLEAEIREMSI